MTAVVDHYPAAATSDFHRSATGQVDLSSRPEWISLRAPLKTTGDGPKALFDAAVDWVLERRVLLPGVTTLARFVASVREQATERLWATLFAQLTEDQQRKLDSLLTVKDEEFVSDFERLRKGPTRVSGTQVKNALKRVAEVREIGFTGFNRSVVPPRRLAELARYGFASKASHLRRHPPPRRYATMLATIIHLHDRAVDDSLDVFDALMATKLFARVKREAGKDQATAFPKLALASSKLAKAINILNAAAQDVPVLEVRKLIETVISSDDLDAALTTVVSMAPAEDSDSDEEWPAKLVAHYLTVRPFLEMLASGIEFSSTVEGAPVLAATKRLPDVLGRKKVRKDAIDSDILTGSWRRLALDSPHVEPGVVDRRAYALCVLEQFWRHLLRREIHAVHSSRWSDPRAKLLDGATWEEARPTILTSLDLPEEPTAHLAEQTRLLDETYRHATERFDENGSVTVDDDGRLHFEALTAEPESASLVALRRAVERMLPRVELPELLLEVASWTGYHEAFTPIGVSSRLENLELSIAALLVAQGCNIGLSPSRQKQRASVEPGSTVASRPKLLAHRDHQPAE